MDLGADELQLVLAHVLHDEADVLRVLGEPEGQGGDASLAEPVLVVLDLPVVEALQLKLLVVAGERLLVRPPLLPQGQLLGVFPVRVRAGDAELVLTQFAVVLVAVGRRPGDVRADTFGDRVVDPAQPSVMRDDVLVPVQPENPVGAQTGSGARLAGLPQNGAQFRLGRRALGLPEASSHRPSQAQELTRQECRDVPDPAADVLGRFDDLPGEVGLQAERESVVGARQFGGLLPELYAHVHLVHGGVAPRGHLGPRRAVRWVVRHVLLLL
ncbi:hypothetical protein [Streptomyces sp. S-2]|uniref:hypothetical protein n=1 Tax=Streptomyces sp. S-2 TaxID=2675217 RepID=UPI001C486455|nr:hypothetical protein [Streptomyces sp. S-2]MBV7254770.1 hypothetical protein [Streptomyces sp. S-2]